METKLTTVSGFKIYTDEKADDSFVIEYTKPNEGIVQLYMNPTTIQARFHYNGSWTIRNIVRIT